MAVAGGGQEPAVDLRAGPAAPGADAPGGPPAVELAGVGRSYGGPPVLQDVDLAVRPGELVCLVGASGCGKSTLLSLVAGLDSPTVGRVRTAGPAALMFQEPALFPWLSAGRNVDLALRLAGVPRRERAAEVERLLALVHLAGQGRRRVHELSGGMRQRVALARALAQRRRVLLMDEPFAALDAITRDVLHAELERVWRATGLSVLFVTHDVSEAVRLGDRVLLLSSRPGTVVREWAVDLPRPRRRDDPAVGALAADVTDELRREIGRHAR